MKLDSVHRRVASANALRTCGNFFEEILHA
jgi:hypothetical protein